MTQTSLPSRSRRSLAAALATTLCLGLVATRSSADEPADGRIPWDQARVTQLAAELNTAVSAVRRAAMNEPSLRGTRSAQQPQAAQRYLDGLRQLERSVGQLSRQLEAGNGYEQTLGTARRIGTLLRDLQIQARRLMVSDQQIQAIDPAIAIIEELSPYYASESPLLPSTRRTPATDPS